MLRMKNISNFWPAELGVEVFEASGENRTCDSREMHDAQLITDLLISKSLTLETRL